jgi:ataxia telangiectasia mutated family protein
MYPNLLLLYGEWLSESMSERPSIILDKYLLKSTQIFEKRGSAGQAEGAKAHFILAKYADQQYQNVVKYMKSELYSEKVANLEKVIIIIKNHIINYTYT